ncbi:MAG: hypothetical protein N2449_09360 [Bacteroidales bacterium]|nr:hypothetical protein [Bacteroidales bacterium]
MKTLVIILMCTLTIAAFSQNEKQVNFVRTPSLTIHYKDLKIIDENYNKNGEHGVLYKDLGNNELFLVTSVDKSKTITFHGTATHNWGTDINGQPVLQSITCAGIPKNCKSEIIIDDKGNIIGGKITVYH